MVPENVKDLVLSSAIPALIYLLVWIAKYITALLKAKTEQIKANTESENAKIVLDTVSTNAIDIVMMLNQTVVEGLKAANADGKLTSEEAIEIKNRAFNMLITMLSEDAKEIISKLYGDVDTYLSNLIERVVLQVKNK